MHANIHREFRQQQQGIFFKSFCDPCGTKRDDEFSLALPVSGLEYGGASHFGADVSGNARNWNFLIFRNQFMLMRLCLFFVSVTNALSLKCGEGNFPGGEGTPFIKR